MEPAQSQPSDPPAHAATDPFSEAMTVNYTPEARIILPAACRQAIVSHCRRKLAETYQPGESRELKAFGLIAGRIANREILIERCLPLLKNVRFREPYRSLMDRIITDHAVPSETPLEKRGWVADPEELARHGNACRDLGLSILGTYHMHRVGWRQDPLRDRPTKLDTVLAGDTGLLMVIVSMVDPDMPRIRGFHEGRPDREVAVVPGESEAVVPLTHRSHSG